MSELTSAAVPPVGPDDHVSGEGAEVIVYADLGCPYCAAGWARIARAAAAALLPPLPDRLQAPARARAARRGRGGRPRRARFWEMCDSLYADRGHVDDPHLWERAERFGLDLERFDADRRSDAVRERVERDFVSGIRAGVGRHARRRSSMAAPPRRVSSRRGSADAQRAR